VAVTICVPALHWGVLRKLEPDAPSPRERLEVIRRLSRAGIACGLRIDPVLPGATDRLHQLRRLIETAAACGALWVDARGLGLPPSRRASILAILGDWRPSLARGYRDRYGVDGRPPRIWEERLRAVVASLAAERGLALGPWTSSAQVAGDPQLRLPFRTEAGGSGYAGNRRLLRREARAGGLAVAG
jgi:DNA repair photolyase